MNPSVQLFSRIPDRIPSRPALALLMPVLVLLPILASPAYAVETGPFGDKIVERGETVGDVYAPVGDVTVNGTVPGDVKTGSGDITVNGRVGGDVKAGWGNIEVKDRVGGDVDAGGGNVYIDAPVGGDVDVGHGSVRLGPKASVGGDVACGSGKIRKERGSTVGGAILTGMSSGPDGFFDDDGGSGVLGFVGWLLATLGFVACSVLISVVAPRPLSSAARSLEGSPGWSLLFGVASVPAVVVLSVVLVVSVVGIPALLLLAPAYLALVFFGALVAAYFLGRKVLLATGRYRGGDALAAVVGALALSAATLIPFFGTLVIYALALLGTGAAILALFARRPRAAHASYEAYVRDRRGP